MKYFIRYWLFRLLVFVCHVLPQRYLYWVALRLGDLSYFVTNIGGREAIKSNLRRVLPNASQARITYETRWVFRNWSKYLTEFFRFRKFDLAFFEKHVALKGQEHIDAALEKGNGCIVLSAHLSNWELGAACLSVKHGYPVNVVAASHVNTRLNNLFVREREAMGINVIPTESAPRQVIRALKRNEIVCILGDRDVTGQGVRVNFFDEPCLFPQGPARFSLRVGAPICPGFVLRRTNDSFTVVFQPALTCPVEGVRDEQVRDLTQQFAFSVEEAIRYHPEEWGVFYRVWEEEWQA